MKLKTNYQTLITFLVLSTFTIAPTNAQLWKRLKKKVQNKVEQKIEEKIDKETDKVIDSTLNGKKPKKVLKNDKKSKIDDRNKSYGSSSIMHAVLYGAININHLSKTKVNKRGKEVEIIGYWDTFGADVHDGYIIKLKNVDDINKLQNKTFKIPEEVSLQLDYDALVKGQFNFDQMVSAPQQGLKFTSGTVTITFNKDENIIINFSGKAKLSNVKTERGKGDFNKGFTLANISGMINTTEPEYTITRERKTKEKNPVDAHTEDEKMEMLRKVLPTVNIPSTFNFNKGIEVKMIDERGDVQNIEFLIGKYPDIYGMSITTKEMQGQKMLIVNTPKAMTMFINMGGMKIKKSTSIEQMGDQYNMEDKIPEEGDFEYKKTGNTKTIIGYLCEEVKVDYNYTNQKGSTSFWVSKKFPIQNKALPMLGMKMNNPNFSGFVLEMNTIQNGKKITIEVTNISDKSVNINTNDYKKMGF
ncbi:MAG: hypothetical protein ABJH82_09800 [Polaribacter sp.]|uniref:hypothetical protein n=1 Tax=Polaribacter sp. TaxID=1920175 RepID=UPI003267648C